MTTLRELLSTPYVMTVRPVRDPATGESTRRAELPEFPECYVDDLSPWDALDRLEEQLPSMIIKALLAGAPVPVPRPPLRHLDAERLLAESGLGSWCRYLDHDATALPRTPANPDDPQSTTPHDVRISR